MGIWTYVPVLTLKQKRVLQVAGTNSWKGKVKSMFSVSPQAARYTGDIKEEKKLKRWAGELALYLTCLLTHSKHQVLILKYRCSLPGEVHLSVLEFSINVRNPYLFSLSLSGFNRSVSLNHHRLQPTYRSSSPFSCCLVEQSIQLCWLAAHIISNWWKSILNFQE